MSTSEIMEFKKQVKAELGYEPQCPICESKEFKIDASPESVRLVVCAKCGKFVETL